MTDDPPSSPATTTAPVGGAPAVRSRELAGAACVVTGGLGFIGSNLALRLADLGARVTVVDAAIDEHGADLRNLERDGPDPVAHPGIAVLTADVGDDAVPDALRGAQVVMNLAGQVSHLSSMQAPLKDLDRNTRSQLALLEHVRAAAPEATVVYASTRQVYGRPRYLPVDEDHPTDPVDVNGIDKLAAERFHLLYARVHGLRATALRLTNVYGPRQSLRHPDLGFLPVFLRRALDGDDITVYGDGEQLRDCLHVDDVVDAFLVAATAPEAVGQVFNLGHPEPLSLRAIAEVVVRAAGGGRVVSVPWPEESSRIDIGSFAGDFSRAKRVLGWEPQVPFAEGIARTVGFYRERPWYRSST